MTKLEAKPHLYSVAGLLSAAVCEVIRVRMQTAYKTSDQTGLGVLQPGAHERKVSGQ